MTAGTTYRAFALWMDDHDQGPGSITVGQAGRAFPQLSYLTICQWIGRYRKEMA